MSSPSSDKIPVGAPGEHRHIPGTVSVHVIYGSATVSACVPFGDVDKAIAEASRKLAGRDLKEAHNGMRQGVIELMEKNAHLTDAGANGICGCALWLAWTAGEYFCGALQEEGRLALFLTDYTTRPARSTDGPPGSGRTPTQPRQGAPTYAAALAELKAEGKCPQDTQHRQVKYLNNIVEADHGKLKQLIRPVRGFKSMKTAYATIKGFEAMRALRKGQAAIFNLTRDIVGEARLVERAFGLGPCMLTEAVQLVGARLEAA